MTYRGMDGEKNITIEPDSEVEVSAEKGFVLMEDYGEGTFVEVRSEKKEEPIEEVIEEPIEEPVEEESNKEKTSKKKTKKGK